MLLLRLRLCGVPENSFFLEQSQCRRGDFDSIVAFQQRFECNHFAGHETRVERMAKLSAHCDVAIASRISGRAECERLRVPAGDSLELFQLSRLNQDENRNRSRSCGNTQLSP